MSMIDVMAAKTMNQYRSEQRLLTIPQQEIVIAATEPQEGFWVKVAKVIANALRDTLPSLTLRLDYWIANRIAVEDPTTSEKEGLGDSNLTALSAKIVHERVFDRIHDWNLRRTMLSVDDPITELENEGLGIEGLDLDEQELVAALNRPLDKYEEWQTENIKENLMPLTEG